MVSKRWGIMDFARTARSGRFTYYSAVAPFNMSHSQALLLLHSRFQFRDSTLGTLFFVFLGAIKLLLNYYVFRLPLIFLFLAVHNGTTGGGVG